MLYFPFWVDVIQDGIGIALVASSKNNHIKVLAHVFDDFFSMRTHIDEATNYLTLKRFEWNFDLISLHHDLAGMNESFVHVKHYCFTTFIH